MLQPRAKWAPLLVLEAADVLKEKKKSYNIDEDVDYPFLRSNHITQTACSENRLTKCTGRVQGRIQSYINVGFIFKEKQMQSFIFLLLL